MAMMNVRIVRVAVCQRRVDVVMAVRLAAIPAFRMVVLVMLVMPVGVPVRHRLVAMLVLVPLRQVQPQATRHQPASNPETRRGLLAHQQRQDRTRKRRQ
jgi:hypothetical protein